MDLTGGHGPAIEEVSTDTDASVNGLRIDRLLASATSSVRHAGTRVTALDVWAFLLPAISFLEITIVGRLIISELLALALLPWLLRVSTLRPPRWLLVAWGAWLASQVITDILVGSAFVDLARGWAGIVFTLVDLTAIIVLAGTSRGARLFALGLATGAILGYFFNPIVYAAADPWKWAFAGPVGLILAAGFSGTWGGRRPWLAAIAFAVFSVVNALLLYRSMSGVAMITAVYLVLAFVVAGRGRLKLAMPSRAIVGVGVYGVSALVVYMTLNAAAAGDLLGDAAKDRYDAQSGQGAVASPGPGASPIVGSNPIGVLAGGRSELLTSPQAILDSPILGHGSWAKDPKYAELQRQRLIELGVPEGNEPTDPNLIPTHSYLLGSWVWAGIAGGVFWLAIACLGLWLIANLFTVRLTLAPLLVFSTTWLLWNIAFSPYGNTQRLYATFGIAVCFLGLRLIKRAEAEAPDGPSGASAKPQVG